MLLDHELIHFGAPALDQRLYLTHLLTKANQLPDMREDFADSARFYWATYREVVDELPWAADIEHRAVRHTLGCLLARVAGRSPLEYLDESERARQREAVLALLQYPPESVPGLVVDFVGRL